MNNHKKPLFIVFALISTIFLFSACSNENNVNSETRLNQGELAPMFNLKDLQGNQMALADLAGKKVYVKYWASWCSICLAGLDELNILAVQENDFKVISVVSPNFKGEMSPEAFTKWFESLSADNITVLLDENGKWAKEFGILGYPTSYYIGSDGILVKSAPGHHSNESITSTFMDIN